MRSKEQKQTYRVGVKVLILLGFVYSYVSFFHEWNLFISGETFQLSKFYW